MQIGKDVEARKDGWDRVQGGALRDRAGQRRAGLAGCMGWASDISTKFDT